VTAAAASTPLTLWRNDIKQGRVSIVGDDLKIWLARRSLVAFIGLNSVSLLSALCSRPSGRSLAVSRSPPLASLLIVHCSLLTARDLRPLAHSNSRSLYATQAARSPRERSRHRPSQAQRLSLSILQEPKHLKLCPFL
jgi:hypothetical protein